MNAAIESALSFVLTGLWRATWQATLLAVVVMILQRVLGKRLGGRGRFALWAVVVVRLLLPVLPESRWSVFNLARLHVSETSSAVAVESASDQIPIIVIGPRSAKPQAAESLQVVRNPEKNVIRWRAWIFAAWIAGVFILALRVAQVCWELSLTIRALSVVSDPKLLRVVESCAKVLHLRRLPRLLVGDDVQTPAVVGLFRPKLLLPTHVLAKCDDREIRLIVLHELAHLKRHDIAGNWLIALASVLHWFNPVVWWLGARMRADRELACDELVLAHSTGEARAYGQTLVKLIEILSPQGRTWAAPSLAVSPRQLAIVGILESTTPMQRRVRMIAQFNPKQSRRWIWTVSILCALGCVALTDAVRAEKKQNASTQPTGTLTLRGPVIDGSQDDAQLQAALATSLPEVKFDAMPFGAVMDYLRDKSGANLIVMWRALEAAGIDRSAEVSLHLKNVTVRQALDHVLAAVGAGTVAMSYAIVDGAIVVSTDEEMSKNTKTIGYDISDLIVRNDDKSRQEAVDNLIKVIQDMAAQDSWQDRGGTTGSIREFNGKLIVQNTPAAQEKVAEILKLLKSEKPAQTATLAFAPGGAPGMLSVNGGNLAFEGGPMPPQQAMPHTTVSDAEIEASNNAALTILKKKLPEVKFDNMALSDVMDFYRDITGANLFVNWQALEAAGIDKSSQVNLRLKDTSFDTVLTATLRQVNAQRLALVIDRGVITITTRDDLPGYMVTKTYDVKNLAEAADEMSSLCSVLQNLTATQEGGGSVQFFGRKLVITATPSTQEQVQKLLAELGAGKSTTRPTQ